MASKQLEIFNCQNRFTMVSGPRLCGKTTGVQHRVIRHLWSTPNARAAVFCKTIKNAKAGVWTDFVKIIMPEWLDANLTSEYGADFGYTVEPKQDGSTRMHYFKIRNCYGGESELQLYSLDYDGDIESAIFGTKFSMFYFSELQYFKDDNVFKATILQMRMEQYGIPYERHQWIADTNPPEEGPEHWAYRIWFKEKEDPDHPDKERQNNIHKIECTLDDNPYLDPRQIKELKSNFAHDPEAYDRFVLGKWTFSAGHADKHFASAFRPTIHVIGSTEGTDEAQWEYLNPQPDCRELICGFDIGDNNHSAHILQKRILVDGRSAWDVIEELVSVGEEMTIEDFIVEFMVKQDALERNLGRRIHSWKYWSDDSAWRFRAGGAEAMDALLVAKVANNPPPGHGIEPRDITLQSASAAKKDGGVRKRVDMIKQLLHEKRLFVSAHCVKTIEMFQELRRGKPKRENGMVAKADFVLRGQPFKHPFDSLTYPIYSETFDELAFGNEPESGTRLISLPF